MTVRFSNIGYAFCKTSGSLVILGSYKNRTIKLTLKVTTTVSESRFVRLFEPTMYGADILPSSRANFVVLLLQISQILLQPCFSNCGACV